MGLAVKASVSAASMAVSPVATWRNAAQPFGAERRAAVVNGLGLNAALRLCCNLLGCLARLARGARWVSESWILAELLALGIMPGALGIEAGIWIAGTGLM